MISTLGLANMREPFTGKCQCKASLGIRIPRGSKLLLEQKCELSAYLVHNKNLPRANNVHGPLHLWILAESQARPPEGYIRTSSSQDPLHNVRALALIPGPARNRSCGFWLYLFWKMLPVSLSCSVFYNNKTAIILKVSPPGKSNSSSQARKGCVLWDTGKQAPWAWQGENAWAATFLMPGDQRCLWSSDTMATSICLAPTFLTSLTASFSVSHCSKFSPWKITSC